jgi:hypothetical protein
MRTIAAILALSVLHGALAAGVPGEILFAERHPGRDYASHYYANFGYDCGDENYWLHGADGGRLAILNPKTGQFQAAKARLDNIKRFDMAGFQPRYEYLREMKRYGVLPASFDLANPAKVDPYELDQKYWRLFWPKPLRPTEQ